MVAFVCASNVPSASSIRISACASNGRRLFRTTHAFTTTLAPTGIGLWNFVSARDHSRLVLVVERPAKHFVHQGKCHATVQDSIPSAVFGASAVVRHASIRGEPDSSIAIETLLSERFVAILPKQHPLAARTSLRPADLREEPFVFYARKMGSLAFDRMIACCEADGFRPRIVQDTPQWPTAVRLIAAGLGVSIAPACVSSLAMPNVVYRRLRSTHRTSVDIGIRRDFHSPVAEAFLTIIRQQFSIEN